MWTQCERTGKCHGGALHGLLPLPFHNADEKCPHGKVVDRALM